MSSVVWCGPVMLAQVRGATVPGAEQYSVSCLGDRPPQCRKIANNWLVGGERLPSMIQELGITNPDPFYLGGFSAGGIVAKLLCESPADRARIRAVMLADAIYGDLWDNEGFVAYAVEGIQLGDRMLVSTNSSAGGTGTTPGNVRLQEVKAEIEKRVAQPFEEISPSTWDGIVPTLPLKLWRLGSVWLADYGYTIGHGHTVLSPGLWQNLLVPWDAEAPPLGTTAPEPVLPEPVSTPTAPSSGDSLFGLLVGGGVAAAGYWLGTKIVRRLRGRR